MATIQKILSQNPNKSIAILNKGVLLSLMTTQFETKWHLQTQTTYTTPLQPMPPKTIIQILNTCVYYPLCKASTLLPYFSLGKVFRF